MGNSATDAFRGLLNWWGSELKGLLPFGADFWSRRSTRRRLVLSVEGERTRLLLERSGQHELLAESRGEVRSAMAELAAIAKRRPGLPVGLRFGSLDRFERIVELPARAEANFGPILDLDMERTTPFRSAGVVTAHHIASEIEAPRGKRAVRHFIIKRQTIDPLVEAMRKSGVEPAFIDCWDAGGHNAAPVDFLAGPARMQAGGTRLPLLMVGLACALAISAILIVMGRNQQALEELAARTAAARSEAAAVRQTVEASQALGEQVAGLQRLLHARPSAARILEELTSVMPDSAWVSDLRIDGDVVEFTGFAASAASIVPLLDASPLLTAADLTSPVVFDNDQNKERFTLRLRLEQSTPQDSGTAEAAKDGSSL